MRVDAGLRCSGAPAVALLRAAITDASSVLMSYADTEAGTVDRLVDPIRIGGGTLTAFDHQAGQVRTFALARMASVAPVAADSIDANPVDSAPGGRR
ncbi:MAG: WYL domain-containing protein [Actinomycetales bacterium]